MAIGYNPAELFPLDVGEGGALMLRSQTAAIQSALIKVAERGELAEHMVEILQWGIASCSGLTLMSEDGVTNMVIDIEPFTPKFLGFKVEGATEASIDQLRPAWRTKALGALVSGDTEALTEDDSKN